MSHRRSTTSSLSDATAAASSLKDFNNTPYKRRKQTSQALEALGQLFKDSCADDPDNNKFNKNDILSLTLSRLLRYKYWPSALPNTNVQLASGVQSSSIEDDLTGFILVVNTTGRIILISDNVEYYLRKNVRALYPQLTSIYDCVSKDDHDNIRRMLSAPTAGEKRAICTWILPRGKRPNRSQTETKSMLLTGHFFSMENEDVKEPLFIARCEQILSSTPNVPTNNVGSTSTTTLRFVLSDQLQISEVSSNTEMLLGYKPCDLVDQCIRQILPAECIDILEQAKQNCFSGEHCTSMNVLDLFTSSGDRLTFLCNTHVLVAGRRKTMKLGFLAQLIDPSIRYDCLIYANKQNIERQKASFQQESIFMPSFILNSSAARNVSTSPTDQCLSVNNSSHQQAKRQRVHCAYLEKENCMRFRAAGHYAQVPFEVPFTGHFSPPPKQELSHADELFNWLEEENGKCNINASGYNAQPDMFGLFTPTAMEMSFF